MPIMRTTLTIDADLAEALKARAHKTGEPWKRVVNEAIRNGLAVHHEPPPPYVTPTTDPGQLRLLGVHGVHDLLAFAEGDDYR